MTRTATPEEAFDHGDPKRYRRGCRCTKCTRATSRYQGKQKFLRETGRGALRSPARAAEHLRKLRAAGMSDVQILRDAQLAPEVLYRILRGEGRIHHATERRVLALRGSEEIAPASRADCDGTGTRRRLQALVAAGWSAAEIGRRLGMVKQQISYALDVHGSGQVEIHTSLKVRALYDELWDQRPEDHGIPAHLALRARLLAVRRGWHPGAVWDDLDDPALQPDYGATSSRTAALVEDTAELARQRLPREVIAERLGATWDAVEKAHSRAGMPVPAPAA